MERTTWLHSIPSAKGSRFSRCEFQMELGKVRYDGIKEAKAKRIWRFTAKCLALATHHYFEGFAVHLTFTNLQILATNLTFTFRFKGHSSDIFHCLMFWAFQLTRAFGGRRVGISKRNHLHKPARCYHTGIPWRFGVLSVNPQTRSSHRGARWAAEHGTRSDLTVQMQFKARPRQGTKTKCSYPVQFSRGLHIKLSWHT